VARWSEMRCCGGGVVGARCRLSLLRSSPVAVVEERALEHGPPRNESPIPAGPPPDSDGMSLALYSACQHYYCNCYLRALLYVI